MSLLNAQIEEQLREVFADMKKDVTLAVFTEKTGCETCEDTVAFMTEIEALSDKIHLEVLDLEENNEIGRAHV